MYKHPRFYHFWYAYGPGIVKCLKGASAQALVGLAVAIVCLALLGVPPGGVAYKAMALSAAVGAIYGVAHALLVRPPRCPY